MMLCLSRNLSSQDSPRNLIINASRGPPWPGCKRSAAAGHWRGGAEGQDTLRQLAWRGYDDYARSMFCLMIL